VEEEAQDGGAHALLLGDGGLHHRLDGVVHARAGLGVEARGQLRRRDAGERQEEQTEESYSTCSHDWLIFLMKFSACSMWLVRVLPGLFIVRSSGHGFDEI
jgi:hypothetical protein